MNKTSEKKNSGWMIVALGVLICLGGVSCGTTKSGAERVPDAIDATEVAETSPPKEKSEAEDPPALVLYSVFVGTLQVAFFVPLVAIELISDLYRG